MSSHPGLFIYHNVARAEPYMHAKFHLDPTNRLATIHQLMVIDRTGQTDRTDNGPIAYRPNRFRNGRPRMTVVIYHLVYLLQ